MSSSSTIGTSIAMPSLGLGTWRMGESPTHRNAEVAAVRSAIAMGYRLIDTAEMYGDGGSEEVVGQAIAEALRANDVRRDELFVVSKVLPHNASRKGTAVACERSLTRLGIDRIDLYLLHWQGPHLLRDTVEALQALVQAGRIGAWGVSNFDTDDMEALNALQAALPLTSGPALRCAANQVYYSLGERGPEFSLLPWQRAHAMPTMAYSPIDQGALADNDALLEIGARHGGASAAQIALAWVLTQPGVVAIPKAVQEAHLRENFDAAKLQLTPQDLTELDQLHPPPRRKTALAMI